MALQAAAFAFYSILLLFHSSALTLAYSSSEMIWMSRAFVNLEDDASVGGGWPSLA